MANPPPTSNNSTAAHKSGAFHGMDAQQSADTPQSSPFGPAPTTPPSGLFSKPAAPKSADTPKSSLFGSVATTTPSGLFGKPAAPKSADTPKSSLFSSAPTTTPSNLFGKPAAPKSADTPKSSLFGSAATTAPSNLFGKPAAPQSADTPKSSLFGSAATTAPSNLFGKPAAPKSADTPKSSLFSSAPTTTSSRLFGGVAAQKSVDTPKSSLFSLAPATTPGGLFGGVAAQKSVNTPKSPTTTPSGLFGGVATQKSADTPKSSLFSLAPATTSSGLFGGVVVQQPVIGSHSSTFAGTPTNTVFGGFGRTEVVTASTSAVNNLPSTTSNLFGNQSRVQQTPPPNKGTAVWSFTFFTEKDGLSKTATQQYQTITFVDPYRNYSLEELRAVDYQQGRRGWGEFRPVNTATSTSPMWLSENTTTSFDTPNSGTSPLFGAPKHDGFRDTLSIPSSKSIRIPTKQAMQLGRRVITIQVGDKEEMQSFIVHEALISTRSNFFRNVRSGNSKEALEKTVNLPEDDPTIFALYEQLLYSGYLPSESESNAVDDIVKEYATLCSFYVLSSKLQDVEAKRAAIDALLGLSRTMMSNGQRTYPLLQHVEIIYYGTHGPCAARRLMVDIYTYRASEDWLEKTFPPDFVFDLAKNVLSKRRTTIDTTLTCKVSDYYDAEEVAEDFAEEVVEEVAEDVAEDVAEEVVEEVVEEVAEEVAEEMAEEKL